MATSRYAYTSRILGRKQFATSESSSRIFMAVSQGDIPYNTTVVRENVRLDHLAGQIYGSSDLWWILAAASGIGWALQVPPGTVIKVPTALDTVFSLIR